MRFNKVNKKGQSLVEVIVACGILGIVMAAMMSIAVASRNLLYQSEEQMKATALAQEGIEIAKHQRDIGCSFTNIKNSDGSLKSNNWHIKGDTDSTNDETLQEVGANTPNQIENFSGFSRTIEIRELSDPQFSAMDGCSGGASDSCFQTTGCGNVETDYDCRDKYYFIRVEIFKNNISLSTVKTIMSKE